MNDFTTRQSGDSVVTENEDLPDFQYTYDPRWDWVSKRVTVLVDSRDRDPSRFPHPNEYEIRLPNPLYFVRAARLVSAEVPGSFYVFRASANNTSLTVRFDNTEHTVTVPDGNYSYTTLKDALEAALNGAFDETPSWTLDFETTGSAARLRAGTSGTVEVVAPTHDIARPSLAWYLGFDAGTTSGTQQVTANRPAILNPEPYLLIDIPELGTLREAGLKGFGGTESTTTFAKVPLNGNSYEYYFHDVSISHNHVNPPLPRLDKLRVRWRFHSGAPVDFYGVDHSFTLELVCVDVRGN